MSGPDDPLGKLQREIDEAKARAGMETPDDSVQKPEGLQQAMRAGTELFAGVGVGGTFGYFIDRFFDTSPVFLILFFFLGFAAGVRNIMRGMNEN